LIRYGSQINDDDEMVSIGLALRSGISGSGVNLHMTQHLQGLAFPAGCLLKGTLKQLLVQAKFDFMS
jgi:hypothetical protein